MESDPATFPTRSKGWSRKWLAVWFAGAVLLYLPGILWGLPSANAPNRVVPFGPDELAPLPPAAELYNVFVSRHPPFNPQYPLFHYFVEALFVGPGLVWFRLTGALSAPTASYPFGFQDPVEALRILTVLGRISSLLAGAGVIVASVWIATRLWGKRVGVFAGLLTATQYSMGYYARTANVDVPALFWIALGLATVVWILERGWTTANAVLFGACAALATATKDASYASFALPGIFLIWRARNSAGRRPLLVAGVTSAICYLLACGVLFHPGRYLDHLHFITGGSPTGPYHGVPADLAGFLSLTGTSLQHVADILGLPTLLLAVAGIGLMVRSERWLLILLGVIPWTLFFVIFAARVSLLRFWIPSCWILGLFAARGADLLFLRRRYLAAACVAIAAGWGLLGQADLLWQSIHDTRYAAAGWFRAHAHAGDHVLFFKSPEKLPALPDGVISVQGIGPTATLDSKPEFVIDVPWESEEISARFVSPSLLDALYQGKAGYRIAAQWKPQSLFSRRPLSFVNPPVTIFQRTEQP